jgi:uncharacterized membrane protein
VSSAMQARKRQDRSEIRRSVLLQAASALVLTLTLWVFLSDAVLASMLWPSDIHAGVVTTFGGHVVREVSGATTIELSLVSVALRVVPLAAALIVAAALTRSGCQSPSTRAAGRSVGRTALSALFRRPAAACIVWSLSWLAFWYVVSAMPGTAWFVFALRSGPYALAVSYMLFIFGVLPWSPIPGDLAPSKQVRWPAFVVASATILWIGVSFWMNERLYAGLWIPHGDSAMYEEHLWNIWHGKGFRSYLDQGLFLGEHIQFIHVLLLPLHVLWPSHLLLELAESFALGICVVPIYSMAVRSSDNRKAAMWLCLLWLCYVPMHFLDIAIDFKTLRPICFGLPFLFFAIDLAEQRRLAASAACLLMTLTAKEDFALVIAPLALVFAWEFMRSGKPPDRGGARWALGIAVLTTAYLLFAVLVLIPWFRGGAPVHYSRYFGDLGSSPADLVRTAVTDPLKVFVRVFSLQTLGYVIVFLVPLAMLPLRRPARLAAGLPTFLMLSLLQFEASYDAASEMAGGQFPPIPYHHFHAPLLPILFWAAAGGLAAGRRNRSAAGCTGTAAPAFPAAFACGVSLLVAVFCSMMPLGAGFWSNVSPFGYQARYVPGRRAIMFEKIDDLLPRTARIASTDYVHTRLTHCARSYDYSDYLRAVNQYRPGVPPDTEYIVIDTEHPYSRIRSLEDVPELQQGTAQWEVVPNESDGCFIILKRSVPRN